MCPTCGSPGVDFSSLAGGAAGCRGCQWFGTVEDLLVMPGEGDVEGPALVGMINDLRALLSKDAGFAFLKFMLKWGFLTGDASNIAGTLDRKAFARYLAAIAKGVLTSLLEERSRVEAARAAERAVPN